MEKAQPFLRWAGSKRKQLPVLSRFWNAGFNRYVEPFAGSACLFFKILPRRALLADINVNLINTFQVVRDHPQAVANRLNKIPLGKISYYHQRGMKGLDGDRIDAAARFIFLNRFCFNGLYRTNLAGWFNVPYAGSGTGNLPSASDLKNVSRALRSSQIIHADFEETLDQTESGDFVYLDPPYAVGNRRIFSQYDPSGFGLYDLQRLAQSLTSLDRKGVSFVLSYAYCSEAMKYFNGWRSKRLFVQRNIAGFSGARRRAGEILFSNINPKLFAN
jgi:DNA adenine methylase